MQNELNLTVLLESGRTSEARMMLHNGVHVIGGIGARSTQAAIEAATRLYAGDLISTLLFMNKSHPWLDGQTPLERAEQSDEGLELVIDMIGAIEAGVYI